METGPPQEPLTRQRARDRRARQIRRRRVLLGACVLLLIILIVGLAVGLRGRGKSSVTTTTTTASNGRSTTSTSTTKTSTNGGAAQTFTADLTGAAEVPPVSTAATGSATLTYDPDDGTLGFVISVSGLTNPSVARIHEGKAGSAGAVVLTLFSGPTKTGVYSGELGSGSVKASALAGALKGKSLADLVALIKAANAYISVGTTSHPNGAIRGQLK
jgi:hypothetical protein